jgi:RNA-splicing ligase RtcB
MDQSNIDKKLEYICKEGDKEGIVFLNRMDIDLNTLKQIKKMIADPIVNNARFMPDCHAGSHGNCVGFTAHINDKIQPLVIGADIACGVQIYNVGDIHKKLGVEIMEEIIRKIVPMGSKSHLKPCVIESDFDIYFEKAQLEAEFFAIEYKKKFNIDIMSFVPKYDMIWLKNTLLKVKYDYNEFMKAVGSLGSGNHFVEINVDKKEDSYITIHSGSRTVGQCIFNYHNDKISDYNKMDWEEIDNTMKKAERRFKDHKELKKISDTLKDEMRSNLHPNYLEKEELYEYFFDMIFAQKYAEMNRRIMLKNLLREFKIEYFEDKIIESVHNYIDFRDGIIRKGAIRAHKDELCIVALNMAEGILICKGKGNQKWNYSCAHGCGRLIPRYQAYSKFSLEEFEESMKDVYTTTANINTLDEAPMCYKSIDMIKKAIEPTVDILEHLTVIINVKGYDDKQIIY